MPDTSTPSPVIRIVPADAHTLGYRDMRLTLGQVQQLRGLAVDVPADATTADIEGAVGLAVSRIFPGRGVTVNAASWVLCLRDASQVEQHIATLIVQQPSEAVA